MSRIETMSINIGKPAQVRFHDKEISTGICKTPVNQALFLSWNNFDGDGQADLVHHGGREKAVCVYAFEHYPYWENELQIPLEYGAFGENLTIRGLLETDVCIGDIFSLGEAIVQVSQPRQPCYKLAAKYGVPNMPLKVQDTGYTGFYFRVLKEGIVSVSDGLTRLTPHPKAITVSFANHVMHHQKDHVEGIKKILEVEELSSSWRTTFLKRLEGKATDTQQRLTGQ